MPTARQTVLIVAGPTGSGKSALASALAEKLNGIVINADSVQMYDALPVLTAQPTPEEKRRIPHCLYGILSPADKGGPQLWRDLALKEIAAARNAQKIPVVTGGTGYYLMALTDGFSPIPGVPVDIRARTVARQKELGNPAFHAELAALDPDMAARLNPNDTQRLIRAREVFDATGESLAHWQSLPKDPPPAHLSFFRLRIDLPRETLYNRINARFHAMLEQGALEEVRDFKTRIEAGDIPADTPLLKAHGYLQLRDHLDGRISLEEAVAASQQITRNYAKRQTTWLKHQYCADFCLTNIENLAESVENISNRL